MSRLSIVIPCLGDAAEFDGTLVSVLQHRPADCEVLVAHRQPYDDPYELDGEVRFLHRPADTLVELVNSVISEATGEVVHILGCGLEATEDWTTAAIAHFADPDVAAVAPLVMARDGHRLLSAGVRASLGGARCVVTDARLTAPGNGRLRSRVAAPTLAAGFYRRDVLAALGGFEAAMGDELADLALGLSLKAMGRLNVVEPASRLVESHASSSAAVTAIARGRAAERLFWRYAAERGLPGALAPHAIEVAVDAVRYARHFAPLMFGRLVACLEVGAIGRYEAALQTAEQRLAELAELRAATQHRSSRSAKPEVAARRKAA